MMLNSLEASWLVDWQMLFNTNKCKVMHLGYNNPKDHYVMGTSQLQAATEETDLGVIVNEDLKRENQCIAVVKKANKKQGMIKRNFADRSEEMVTALYKSLVRPHLEYCTRVWRPYLIKVVRRCSAEGHHVGKCYCRFEVGLCRGKSGPALGGTEYRLMPSACRLIVRAKL